MGPVENMCDKVQIIISTCCVVKHSMSRDLTTGGQTNDRYLMETYKYVKKDEASGIAIQVLKM